MMKNSFEMQFESKTLEEHWCSAINMFLRLCEKTLSVLIAFFSEKNILSLPAVDVTGIQTAAGPLLLLLLTYSAWYRLVSRLLSTSSFYLFLYIMLLSFVQSVSFSFPNSAAETVLYTSPLFQFPCPHTIPVQW